MLQMVLGIAFAAMPVMLLIPSIRRLSTFVNKVDEVVQELTVHGRSTYVHLRYACSRLLASLRFHFRY